MTAEVNPSPTSNPLAAAPAESVKLKPPLRNPTERELYGGDRLTNDLKADRRVKLRVHNAHCAHLALTHGAVIGIGTTDVVMYQHEYETIRGIDHLVAGPDEPQRQIQAREHLERGQLEEIRVELAKMHDRYETLRRNEVQELLDAKDPDALKAREEAEKSTTLSLPASYQLLFEHSMPPITKMEVIDPDMPMPDSVQQVEQLQVLERHAPALAAAVSKAIGEAMAQALGPLLQRNGNDKSGNDKSGKGG